MPLPRAYTNYVGREEHAEGNQAERSQSLHRQQEAEQFAVRSARQVIWPLLFRETSRAGLRLLPMFL